MYVNVCTSHEYTSATEVQVVSSCATCAALEACIDRLLLRGYEPRMPIDPRSLRSSDDTAWYMQFFAARPKDSFASAVHDTANPSVRLSVRPSVRHIRKSMSSPVSLVF